MKLRLVISGVALLLLASAVTVSQERMRLTRYVYKYTVKIFDEDIEKMPSWNPETEEAPLSPRKAIEVARENISRFILQDSEKWVLENVSLSQVGSPGSDRWLYQAEFTNNHLLGTELDYGFSIFVKMDGTVVEPEVVPNDGTVRVY